MMNRRVLAWSIFLVPLVGILIGVAILDFIAFVIVVSLIAYVIAGSWAIDQLQ